MSPKSSTITLATLTPIWTGGADGKSDRLHITSIIGSLRWWYEVLIRSVGGRVCDREKPCIYESSKPQGGICDVCRVFGTTGWARRFKLVVVKDTLQPRKPVAAMEIGGPKSNLRFNLSTGHPASHSPGHKWYLPGNPLYGQVTLNIVATGALDKEGKQGFDPSIISALFQFISYRASIGAKPQMGLGVVRLTKQQSIQPLITHLKQVIASHEQNKDLKMPVNEELPCLQNMFFTKVQGFSMSESSTFDLKYNLRAMFRNVSRYEHMNHDLRNDEKDTLRHTIMGYVKMQGNERIGAKIMMSYPYDDKTIRLWGWIPALPSVHVSLDDTLSEIYYFLEGLKDEYGEKRISSWLDYDPHRNGSILRYMEEFFSGEVE